MKRYFRLTYFLLVLLGTATVVTTQSSCSSPKKGYNYSSHNKKNHSAQREGNKRMKKAGYDQLNFKCPNYKKR
jgi:hypothetical protein